MRVTKVSLGNSALTDALSIVLPLPEQTWLLRACLHPAESGRQAWETYLGKVGDPKKGMKRDRWGGKELAPLLLIALQHNGVVADEAVLTYLRIAYLREELRTKTYRRMLRDVLLALAAEGVPHICLKGAALADTVYEDPVLRHCHGINILLHEGDVFRAASVMPPSGFVPLADRPNLGQRPFTLIHKSGLPLHLHRRLFTSEHYNVPFEDLLARSQIESIAGVSTRILSPADTLLHVCIQACFYSGYEAPRWVSDAWHIVARYPNLDWSVLLDCALRNHLALPLSVSLSYLTKDLNAPIPKIILDRLCDTASQTDPMRGEATLATALAGMRLSLRSLVRMAGGWRPRALVLKWILFPSPGYLRSAYHVTHSWLLPLYYVYRPLRYVARRIRWRCRDYLQLNALQKHLMPPEVKPGA
jgi:hypothetical protein